MLSNLIEANSGFQLLFPYLLDLIPVNVNLIAMRNQSGVYLLVLVALASLLGGGGVAYGLANLVVQIGALALLLLRGPAALMPFHRRHFGLVVLVVLTLLLPIMQMIPLPPAIWTILPGRTLIQDSMSALGSLPWSPLTVNASRTLVSFIGLIAPFAVIAFTLSSDQSAINRAKITFFAIGVTGVLLGAAQLLYGQGQSALYAEATNQGMLTGLFANRNSAAIFFVCCLLLLCGGFPRSMASIRLIATSVGAMILVVGVILTQSRTGLVLLTLPAGLLLLRTAVDRHRSPDVPTTQNEASHKLLLGGLVAVVTLISLGVITDTLPASRVDSVLARFGNSAEERPKIWEDARFSARRYWPVGAGMGTFDEVFQVDESLENVSSRRAGRAHNDYLEVAIEAGAFGLLLVTLWSAWTIWATWVSIASTNRWEALAATGILLSIALQSLLDYPLRNQTMLCLAAFSIALLSRTTAHHRRQFSSDGRKT